MATAGVVGIAAVAVNAVDAWVPSLWGDEAASVLSATRSIPTLLQELTRVDAVHGAYYLFLNLWVRVFGESPLSVRFPSLIGIGLTVAVVVWIGARLRSLPFGVLAGAVTALVPRMMHAAIETRAYVLDALVAALIVAVAIEIVRRPGAARRWWIAYGVLLGLGTLLFLYTGLMAFAVAGMLWWAKAPRRDWRNWLIASAAAFVVLSPFLALALGQHNQVAFLGTHDYVSPKPILVDTWFVTLPYAVVAWILIVAAVVLWARRRPQRALDPVSVALAWFVLPSLVLFAGGLVIADFTARYLTFVAPAAGILIASALTSLARLRPRPWIALAAAVALVAVTVPDWAGERTPYAKRGSDWTQVAALIQQQSRPGDAIIFDDDVTTSWRPRLALDTNPTAFANVKDVTLKTSYKDAPLWYSQTRTPQAAADAGAFDGVQRVWAVEVVGSGAHVAGQPDEYGFWTLEQLGYRPVQTTKIHVSQVTLFERAAG